MLALSGGSKMKVFALGNEKEYEPVGVWLKEQYKLLV
jgi:hypothetical protein